ncbi:MAG: winged helix-turn-helix domain-containing protein [Candidatus Sulfotelmatobacter sp.]|jgi:DNA-binding winged helix-turn-helix (wHTH) protein
MEQPPVKNETRPRTLRFGAFEVHPHTQELRKQGARLRLPAQSVQVLLLLLENPGELVSREELRKKLWPEDTFVDFDHGVNAAVNRLREALGDSAEKPKFVETLPRRGYRFIAAVDGLPAPAVERSEQVPSVASAPEGVASAAQAAQPSETSSAFIAAGRKLWKVLVPAAHLLLLPSWERSTSVRARPHTA